MLPAGSGASSTVAPSKLTVEGAANAPGAGWQAWKPSSAIAAASAGFVPANGLGSVTESKACVLDLAQLSSVCSGAGGADLDLAGMLRSIGLDVGEGEAIKAGDVASFFAALCGSPECADGVVVALHALASSGYEAVGGGGAGSEGGDAAAGACATARRVLEQLGDVLARADGDPALVRSIRTQLGGGARGGGKGGGGGGGAHQRGVKVGAVIKSHYAPGGAGSVGGGSSSTAAKPEGGAASQSSFDPAKSLWKPRMETSDSKSLFDTERVKQRRFYHDWQRALDLGVTSLIMRYDDDAALDADGDGIPDEVVETSQALWLSADLAEMLCAYARAAEPKVGP